MSTLAKVTYGRLTPTARDTIRWAHDGATIAGYIRWRFPDGQWHGDACGCTDDRCIGYHHDENADCQCLPVLLEQWWVEAVAPSTWHVDITCGPSCSVEWHVGKAQPIALGPLAPWDVTRIRDIWTRRGDHTATMREVTR